MPVPVRTYNLKKMLILVDAVPVTGFSETDAVEINSADDLVKKSSGADGREVTRSIMNNGMWTLTFKLKQTSPINSLFTAYALRIINGGDDADIFSLAIKDTNGLDAFLALYAWVEKWPDLAWAREAGDREWTIGIADAYPFVGGTLAIGFPIPTPFF